MNPNRNHPRRPRTRGGNRPRNTQTTATLEDFMTAAAGGFVATFDAIEKKSRRTFPMN